MAKQAQNSDPDTTIVVPEPPLQISVREWAAGQADRVGMETAAAFVALFGRDTATAEELEHALTAFITRKIA